MASSFRQLADSSSFSSPGIFLIDFYQSMKTRVQVIAVFVLYVTAGCNNRSASDRIMEKFESVSNSLRWVNERVEEINTAIYDSIAKKYGESKLGQFRYHVNDCISYFEDLKYRFIVFCGDSSGRLLPEESLDDINLSGSFFIKEGNGEKLQAQLQNAGKVFLAHAQSPELIKRIKQLGAAPSSSLKKSFAESYFQMTPPVAAMAIISKFENDMKQIESIILQEYLSK
jgi:hypothetical protein